MIVAGAVGPEDQPLRDEKNSDDEEEDVDKDWSSSRKNVRGSAKKDESDSDFEFDL